jgi:hypothetical protein
MSYANFVKATVSTPLTAVADSITLVAGAAPYNLPPTDGGVLLLTDSIGNPSLVEVIQYTARAGLVLSGVVRGMEGTTARAWSGIVYCCQPLTAGGIARGIGKPTASTLAYNGAGQLSTVTDTVNGVARVTTMTYNPDSTLQKTVAVMGTLTRTETLTYTAGVLTSTTTSEVYA